jgi:glycosyltransferase involved in cell wall biosynthesis
MTSSISPSETTARPLRVCYFGAYREEYPRNQAMIYGLRRAGVEVIECHRPLWHSIADRVQVASGGWLKPRFWLRLLRAYSALLAKYRRVGEYDLLIVGYPGHYDVFLARLLAWLRGKPLVWDVFNSLYLISLERGICARHPFSCRVIRLLEKIACRLPHLMVLDNQRFVDWFCQLHRADPQKFCVVHIGADERQFTPAPPEAEDPARFTVIYFGAYIPNHGVEFIIEAARLLAGDPGIHFEMIGDGPTRRTAQDLAARYSLPNVAFTAWLERPELTPRIARAQLVLGAFGVSQQITLTNNNKIYEAFAMQKAVISGASPAMPTELVHGQHLYLCERGDPASLAEGIRLLKADPQLRLRLARQGYELFYRRFDTLHIGQDYAACLQRLLAREGRP